MSRAEQQSGGSAGMPRAEHSARLDDYVDVTFRCPVCGKKCVTRVSARMLEESAQRAEMDFGEKPVGTSLLVCESCYNTTVRLVSPRRN